MSKPGKVLRTLCKRLGVRLTVKRGKKRVYKRVKVLKAQCNRKKKKKVKKKRKVVKRRRRKFGSSSEVEYYYYSDDEEMDIFNQVNAALTLQALQRGRQARKEFKEKREKYRKMSPIQQIGFRRHEKRLSKQEQKQAEEQEAVLKKVMEQENEKFRKDKLKKELFELLMVISLNADKSRIDRPLWSISGQVRDLTKNLSMTETTIEHFVNNIVQKKTEKEARALVQRIVDDVNKWKRGDILISDLNLGAYNFGRRKRKKKKKRKVKRKRKKKKKVKKKRRRKFGASLAVEDDDNNNNNNPIDMSLDELERRFNRLGFSIDIQQGDLVNIQSNSNANKRYIVDIRNKLCECPGCMYSLTCSHLKALFPNDPEVQEPYQSGRAWVKKYKEEHDGREPRDSDRDQRYRTRNKKYWDWHNEMKGIDTTKIENKQGDYKRKRDFGRKKRKSRKKVKKEKISSSLKKLCKKHKVRLTVKRGKKRVYKSVKVLKAQCAKKKKKVKRKRRRKFGSVARMVPVNFRDVQRGSEYTVIYKEEMVRRNQVRGPRKRTGIVTGVFPNEDDDHNNDINPRQFIVVDFDDDDIVTAVFPREIDRIEKVKVDFSILPEDVNPIIREFL